MGCAGSVSPTPATQGKPLADVHGRPRTSKAGPPATPCLTESTTPASKSHASCTNASSWPRSTIGNQWASSWRRCWTIGRTWAVGILEDGRRWHETALGFESLHTVQQRPLKHVGFLQGGNAFPPLNGFPTPMQGASGLQSSPGVAEHPCFASPGRISEGSSPGRRGIASSRPCR